MTLAIHLPSAITSALDRRRRSLNTVAQQPTHLTIPMPEDTVSVVFISHTPGGNLGASHAEVVDRVPATRRQTAVALRMLADAIEADAVALDLSGVR